MDNILIAEIKRVLEKSKNKKIIVWGTANIAAYVFSTIRALSRDIEYFVDSMQEIQGNKYYDKDIKSPYDIMYENLEEIIVILAFTNSNEVKHIVELIGLEFEKNCFDLKKIEQPKRCDMFDPFLGYTRIDDIEGYKIINPGLNKKIIILGGSTTDWSVSGINAWPVYFNEKLKSEGILCSVYNGAIVGYYSSQELLKLVRDIVVLQPDLVISYSGINDADWVKTNKMHPYICDYLKNSCEKMVKNNIVARSSTQAVEQIGYGMKWEEDDVELWISNMRMMHAICQEFSIPFFSFLQPTQFYGNYNLTKIEKQILIEQYTQEHIKKVNHFFEQTSIKIKEYGYIYDFTNIFDGQEGIFYDSMHADERGNKIIANKIFDIVKERVEWL